MILRLSAISKYIRKNLWPEARGKFTKNTVAATE